MALENTNTGRPVIREVVKVADAYPGPHTDRFADLLAVWEADHAVVAVRSDELGRFEGSRLDRAGNHRPGGWFTMAGPTVPALTNLLDAEIVDPGLTVARLVGVDLEDVDGRMIEVGELVPSPAGESRWVSPGGCPLLVARA